MAILLSNFRAIGALLLPILALIGCATIDRESSLGDFAEPGAEGAAPQTTNLGNIGVYITSAQTPTLSQVLTRPANAEDSDVMTSLTTKLRTYSPSQLRENPPEELGALSPYEAFTLQKAIYGRLYSQLRVRTTGDWSPDATSVNPRIISCDRRATGLGAFLAAIVGYKKSTTATLTITIAPTLGAVSDENSANDYLTNYPVLIVKRNKKSGRGYSCEYELNVGDNALPLTPQIYPETNDALYLKFQVHYAKDQSVDFSTTLGLLSSIGALATPSEGFTKNVAAITSAQLDTQINNFLSFFAVDVNAKTTRMVKLSPDATNPYDRLVFSLNAPLNDDSFDTLSFDNGPAISFEMQYYPTLFAECGGFVSLAKCQKDFAADDEIVGKLFAINPQSTLMDISDDPPAGQVGGRSLAGQLIDTLNLTEDEARAQISTVCRKLSTEETFKPIGALNTIDRLIFRYVWLTSLNGDLKKNRRLLSETCFTEEEEGDLRSLSVYRPRERFPFPSFKLDVADSVFKYVYSISGLFLEGLAGKQRLFGDDGVLRFDLTELVETSNGDEIRQAVTRGETAATVLDSIKLGNAACPQIAFDRRTGQETDRLFGFMVIARDTAPGGLSDPANLQDGERVEFYAPVVITLKNTATYDDPNAESVVFPSSIAEYLNLLDSSITPQQFWGQSCFADLTSSRQAAALAKSRELFGALN